jgi:hypothetical protein
MPTFVIPNSFGTAPLREENLCHEPGGTTTGGQFAKKNAGVCAITPTTKTHKKKGENVSKLNNAANPETVKLVLGDVDVNEVAKGMVADVEWDQPFEVVIKTEGGPFDERLPGYFIHNLQGQHDLRRNLETRFRGESTPEQQASATGFETWVQGTSEFKDWAQKNYRSYGGASPTVRIMLNTPGGEVEAMRIFKRQTLRNPDGTETTRLIVTHHFFEVTDAAPAGLGKQLFRGSVEEYERLGVERISTHANIDVGGYAWGRYGFAPTDALEVYPEIRDKVREAETDSTVSYTEKVWDPVKKLRVEREVETTLTPKTLTALTKLVARLGAPAAHNDPAKEPFWALIDAHVPGEASSVPSVGAGLTMTPATFSIGKWLMLGTGWEGHLNLKDPAQARRLRHYLYGNN